MKHLPPYLVEADPISTAASAMAAQRVRMNTIANNMANIKTTRNDKGEFQPYLRKEVLLKTAKIKPSMPDEQGVEVHKIIESKTPLKRIYDPEHPEANGKGYRFEPNVSIPKEMINMIEATRLYEANLRGMKAAGSALKKTTSILDQTSQ